MKPSKRVYWAIVEFSNKSGFKQRPVLVVQENEIDLTVFGITSQYENKSAYIKQQYAEIKEWRQIPLPKPSWIDVGTTITLSKSQYQINFAGTISDGDYDTLIEVMERVNQRNKTN